MYKFCIYFLKCILKCFVLFDAVVNVTVLWISFLDSSLLIHRNTADFFMLVFCPETLLNSLTSSNGCVCGFLMFSVHTVVSSAREMFCFFLGNLDFFCFFVSLGCSGSLWYSARSGGRGHPCLVKLPVSSMSVMAAVGVIGGLYWTKEVLLGC